MKKVLEEYSVKPTKLFKRIFFVYLFGYIPFLVLEIILNLANIMPVNLNNKDVYGLEGVAVLVGFAPFVILLFSFMTWLNFSIGILFMRLLKKLLYA